MAGLLRRGLALEGWAVGCRPAMPSMPGTRSSSTPYDAVVCDGGLPGPESGLDWCRWFRNEGHETPVLMLTARTDVGDRIAGLDCGADDYLGKPFAFGELAARLRALQRRASTASADGPPRRGPEPRPRGAPGALARARGRSLAP